MKKLIVIFILFFNCKENKDKISKEGILVSICKKEMLDNNSLIVELQFDNNSENNYLLPISPEYILENRKKKFNPVFGRIISSDFTYSNDYKMNLLLEDYTGKYLYKNFSHQSYKMAVNKDYEGYANSLLFIPKKTKKSFFLIFNIYESCNDNLKKCNGIFYENLSKINLKIINHPENFETLDSMLEKQKMDYLLYRKSLYLKDSLYINK